MRNMRTLWNNRNHSVGFSNTMSKQLEAGNETFISESMYGASKNISFAYL